MDTVEFIDQIVYRDSACECCACKLAGFQDEKQLAQQVVMGACSNPQGFHHAQNFQA